MRHRIGIVLIVLAGLLVLLVVFAFLYRSQLTDMAESILPRCSVGFQGTKASVTVIGLDAENRCQQLIQEQAHSCDNKPNCSALAAYEMSSEPTTPEMCEGDYQGDHYIVRDEGVFDIVGNALCSHFFPASTTTQPSSTVTPSTNVTPTTIPQTSEVHIYDNANVLNASQVQSAAQSLPDPMDIYTTNTFNGNSNSFTQQTQSHVISANLIVMAIDTVHHYLTIEGGSSVPLSNSQYQDAVNAFRNNYNNSDYTGATIAAIDSLKSSLSTAIET